MSGRIVVECAAPEHPKGRTAKLETFTRHEAGGWMERRENAQGWPKKAKPARALWLAQDQPLPAVSIDYDSVGVDRHQRSAEDTALAEAIRAGAARERLEFRCPLCPDSVGPVVARRERLSEILDRLDGLGVARIDLEQLRRILASSN